MNNNVPKPHEVTQHNDRLPDKELVTYGNLVVAQYTSLRNEIRGNQQDEAAMLTAAFAAVGAVVSISAWQNLSGLMTIVALFIWMVWRKMIAGSSNTFRIAAFIKAYYENSPIGGSLCWENALESFRKVKENHKNEASWQQTQQSVVRLMIVCVFIATVFIYFKSDTEIKGFALKQQQEALQATQLAAEQIQSSADFLSRPMLFYLDSAIRAERLASTDAAHTLQKTSKSIINSSKDIRVSTNFIGALVSCVSCIYVLYITYTSAVAVGGEDSRNKMLDWMLQIRHNNGMPIEHTNGKSPDDSGSGTNSEKAILDKPRQGPGQVA